MQAILSARSLTKTYGGGDDAATSALCGIDIDVSRSEMLGVMGPSGSGKSTLMNLIGGIDRPTSGTITLCGRDASAMTERELTQFRRQHLGFVFQDFNLLDGLTVWENIALPLILDHVPPLDIESRVEYLVETLGLGRLVKREPHQLSGGEQQRVAIARAIANEPDVLLADEPTGNLDTVSSESVLECLQLLRTQNRAVVIVTHSPLVASRCERVLFIMDGVVRRTIRRDAEPATFADRLAAETTYLSDDVVDA